MNNSNLDKFTYQEDFINSALLESPRNLYQRVFSPRRAQMIADHFDERIANEPKVSRRDGHYYVFDGQHTIAARRTLNGGEHLPVKCKVYYGLTEQEEANLFAQQTGFSAKLTPGERMRALVCAGDEEALAFLADTEDVGLHLDYGQEKGDHRIGCIGTAFREYKRAGSDVYKQAMGHIVDAWNGDPHSLRSQVVQGVIRFVALYHSEYNQERLIHQLRRVDPLTIYREGRAMGDTIGRDKRYMYQVFLIYNGTSGKYALPVKF